MRSGIRTAVQRGLTHHHINGNIGHWLQTYRNDHGEHPTMAEFIAGFEAEQLAHITEKSKQPCPPIEDE